MFYLTVYYTGCREGEVLALKKEDISLVEDADPPFGVISITKQRTDTRKHKNNPYVIVPPKTESSRRETTIPFDFAKELLKLEEKDGLLFPYHPRYVRLIWERLREAGYAPKDATIHHLRRSHETEMINKGVPPELFASAMGHSITTALKYYKLHGKTPYKEVIAAKLYGSKNNEEESAQK
jgi:integrase